MVASYQRTRSKLFLGFFLGIAALLVVGYFAFGSANDFIRTSNDLATHQSVLKKTSELRTVLTRAESDQRGYLLTADRSMLRSFKEAPGELQRAFKELHRSSPNYDANLANAEQIADQKMREMQHTIDIFHKQGVTPAQKAGHVKSGESLMTQFRNVLNEVDRKQEQWTKTAARENHRNRKVNQVMILGGLAFAILTIVISLGFVVRDLRLRLEAENWLQQSRALQKLILDAANVAIIASDQDGRITLFNRAAEEWLGYTSKEIVGCTDLASMIHDPMEMQVARRELQREYGEDAVRNGRLFTVKPLRGERFEREWTYIRKDRSRFPAFVSFSPLYDGEGQVVGFVALASDLTREKEARAQLDQYVREIELARAMTESKNRELVMTAHELQESRDLAVAATRTKSEFLANMSHEIRTPMNGVMGMAHLLQGTPLNERQRGFVSTILKSAESLLTILNDILDLSKMEAGKMTLEHFPFNLRDALEDVSETLAPVAHAKGLELTCRLAPGVPEYVLGDPGRLRQIVANLVSNAIKFTAEGEVVVFAQVIRENPNRATYRISVRDTGIGIPTDRQERIFESFTQADGSTTRQFGGTGLGLAICRQLVELLGGTIGVISEPGQGSEFWFEVVLARQDSLPDARVKTHDLSGRQILIVDDNATNRTILSELLTVWNCRVRPAESGEDALAILRGIGSAEKFDAAVLDLHMPGIDGIELARQIRYDQRFADLPMVLLSSSGYMPDESDTAALFGSVLFKPIRSSPLYDALAHVTQGAVPAANPEDSYDWKGAERLKGLRVLVVEDNVVNQMVATELLANWGCEAFAADNGAAAVSMVEHVPFDLVLMDVQMPVMDGIEATQEIRRGEAGRNRHIPILAMTANAMSGDREHCLRAGMDGYLSKPLQPKKLWEQILNILDDENPGGNMSNESDFSGTLFERSRLEETCSGKVSLIVRVIDRYIATSLTGLLELESSAVDGDAVRLASAAHALKGSSLTVGSPRVAELCQTIEHESREGIVNVVAASRVRASLLELHATLQAYEAEIQTPSAAKPL